MQATRQGWPYYRRSRRPPARGGPRSGNGSPCAPDAGHPQGVALEVVTEARARPMQATRKGWPYYIRSRRPPTGGLHGEVFGRIGLGIRWRSVPNATLSVGLSSDFTTNFSKKPPRVSPQGVALGPGRPHAPDRPHGWQATRRREATRKGRPHGWQATRRREATRKGRPHGWQATRRREATPRREATRRREARRRREATRHVQATRPRGRPPGPAAGHPQGVALLY